MNNKNLHCNKNKAYKPAYKRNQKESKIVLEKIPEDLLIIVSVWKKLPEAIRSAITVIIKTMTK